MPSTTQNAMSKVRKLFVILLIKTADHKLFYISFPTDWCFYKTNKNNTAVTERVIYLILYSRKPTQSSFSKQVEYVSIWMNTTQNHSVMTQTVPYQFSANLQKNISDIGVAVFTRKRKRCVPCTCGRIHISTFKHSE